MNKRETDTVFLEHIESQDVLHVTLKKEFEMTVADFQVIEQHMREMLTTPVYIIIDGSKSDGFITYEAQEAIAHSEYINSIRIMTIFVVKNLAQRLIANFYIRHLKKRKNFKIVTKIEKAFQEIDQKKMAS